MMSKAPRWNDVPANTKINKPAQKKPGKEAATSSIPVCVANKQTGSETTKSSVGRSNSLGNRGGDLNAAASKVGGSLKGGSSGRQAAGQASHRSRPALRLCSSRSFSSFHGSSLSAPTFIRSSRSLSRLDQRATGEGTDSDHATANSQVKKIQATGRKFLHYGRRSSSLDQIRDKKDQSHSDSPEKMKTSSSLQPLSHSELCSSLVSATCHEKKQTKDGVYTLCAMTSGMRRNWVQTVLKNVRPGLTHEATGFDQNTEHPQEHQSSDEGFHLTSQYQEEDIKGERSQRSPDGGALSLSSPVPPSACSALPSASHLDQIEENDAAAQCSPIGGSCVTDASLHVDESQGDSPDSTAVSLNYECLDQESSMQRAAEQRTEQCGTTVQTEDQRVSINAVFECIEDEETLPCEIQTAQLLKELEKTQRELSQMQQLNRILQDELQQQRNDTNPSPEHSLTFQHLQKINHDLRSELEAQKRSQEEARETELRRRVDLLAQQAQLLVTGDATALAQAHLEKDRRRFQEQQVEWEHCLASLKSQLTLSEEQRREAESRLTELQQELQSHHDLQQEAEQLRKHLQEVSTEFRAHEEAQVEKEGRLQKHLALLQASQERERRSFATSLTQAEQHSLELQERLERAEEQVESLHKSQALTKEIEEAQRQLQEELTCTVSAVQQLQEERDQLSRHCQELQNQLSDADRELNRVQGRLQTDETHYYNLEHSYETVCEQLQVALGRVEQRESDTQEIREGYERLLDRKEQELSEVLLKMEVLGNSLEETEVKLNEVLKSCTCTTSNQKGGSSELQHAPVAAAESRLMMSNSSDVTDMIQDNGNEHVRTRSKSIDASYQYISSAGYDPERFMSVIQSLETKLYVTEEKLRDITQRLEEHQSHTSCQDPHLCSQLTQSRATAQHLSLLLHSQAKQSQRFAQETENCCRMLVGRFQVALNIVQACRERLQATPINLLDLERQLAGVAACLRQGEVDAEKRQHDSHNASKGDSKILADGKLAEVQDDAYLKNEILEAHSSADDERSVEKCLMRELFVLEKMVSALQSRHVVFQLSTLSQDNKGDMADRYKNIISQRLALKAEEREECFSNEALESQLGQIFAEAELIYAALKFQLQYESVGQADSLEVDLQRAGLADVSPPELAPYEEQVDATCSEEPATAMQKEQLDEKPVEAEKEPAWLRRLTSRLQERIKSVSQLCQQICGENAAVSEISDKCTSAAHLKIIQEQAKLIYLSDRLYVDLEEELQQDEMLQDKLQTLSQEKEVNLLDEHEAFNDALCQLQEDNNVLREGLKQVEQKVLSVEAENQRLLEDIKKIRNQHEEQIQKLETEFQEKLKNLQQIHEEEMKNLHDYYTKSKERQTKICTETNPSAAPNQTEMEKKTNEDNEIQMMGGDSEAMREAYRKDLERLKESFDQEFSAVEEMHRKQIENLQQQHQQEKAELLRQKDQLLQEETAATLSAIVAMRRAHKHELEKSRRAQRIRESADITQLCAEYEGEIQLLQKELQALSAQHTEKCLENSQLSQELQEERKSVSQYQKENQELKNNQRESDDLSQLQFPLNGKQMHVVPQVNDFYEMEVILRAREAEMQFLRHEAHSLKEELKIARMDKIYAQNKLKALCTNNQDEPRPHVNTLGEEFPLAAWSPSKEPAGQTPDDPVTNTTSAAFPKKHGKSSLMRQIRGVRPKSLKDGLSVQERMKLFDSF